MGSWAGRALDAYLEDRTRAGRPIPLFWHKGVFRVVLDGAEVKVGGMVSPPFAYYQGDAQGPARNHPRTLVNLLSTRKPVPGHLPEVRSFYDQVGKDRLGNPRRFCKACKVSLSLVPERRGSLGA